MISESIKSNVRAVLLSKTDGKGVLVSTFLRDYKSIIGEALMYRSMGYDSLESFIKEVPDVCRLEYAEKEMAYKLFGISKPNAYASSFMKRAEGTGTDTEDAPTRHRRGDRKKTGKGDKIPLSSDLDEEWLPNPRGHISLCFPNRPGNGMENKEDVALTFAALGEVAEINMIPQMTFVRYTSQAAAKKAVQMYGQSLGLRRADERKIDKKDRDFKPSRGSENSGFKSSRVPDHDSFKSSRGPDNGGFKSSRDDDWDDDPDPGPVNNRSWAGSQPTGSSRSGVGSQPTQSRSQPAQTRDVTRAVGNREAASSVPVKDTVLSKPRDSGEVIQVYVGNLPAEVQQDELESLFKPYTHVGIRIKHAGKSMKTYAFVDFTDTSEARLLIRDLHDSVLNGRTLKIRFANQHMHDTLLAGREGFTGEKKDTCEETCPKIGSIEKQFEQLAVHRGHETVPEPSQQRKQGVAPERQFEQPTVYREHENVQVQDKHFEQHRGREIIPERQFEQSTVHGGRKNTPQSLSPIHNISRTVTNDYATAGAGRSPTKRGPVSPASFKSGGSSPMKMPPLENNIDRVVNGYDDEDNMPLLEEIQSGRRDGGRLVRAQTSVRGQGRDLDMPPLERVQLPVSPGMPQLERVSPRGRYGAQGLQGMPDLERASAKGRYRAEGSQAMPELEVASPRGRYGAQGSQGSPQVEQEQDQQSVQLFVGNFPYGTKEEELLNLLGPFGVLALTMMNKEVTNRSTYAFATCCDMMHAERAIAACDQTFFRGRKLTVTLANPTLQLTSAESANSSLNMSGAPFANITCTVGGDAGRQVYLEEPYDNPSLARPQYGRDKVHPDRNTNLPSYYGDAGGPPAQQGRYREGQAGLSVKTDFNYRRLTCLLKDYNMMVSKLRGDDRFAYAPGTTVAVLITHVENDKVFWGQVIKDSVRGQNSDLQQLVSISHMLQEDDVKHMPIKGLGRCTAMFGGEWFRAWCMHVSVRDGQEYCHVLFVDYGNSEEVLKSEVFLTDTRRDVWTLPPIARPFKLQDARYDLDTLTNKLLVFEIADPGCAINNFVTTVIGKFDQ